jgi:hypothetical protein
MKKFLSEATHSLGLDNNRVSSAVTAEVIDATVSGVDELVDAVPTSIDDFTGPENHSGLYSFGMIFVCKMNFFADRI